MNQPGETPRPADPASTIGRGPDRRARPTRPWDFLRTPARRAAHRRAHDQPLGAVRFVDRHPRSILATAIALLVLTLIDGALTLLLVRSHCVEANPVMAYMLEQGAPQFLASKFLLTAAGVGFLVCARTYPMFGTRFQVGRLPMVLAALYLVLLGYQGYLLVHGPNESRPATAAAVGAGPR